MKSTVITTAFGLVLALASAGASATEESNLAISSVGVTNGGGGFVQFKQALSVTCKFNVVFLGPLDQAIPKAMLATLLAAQSRGSSLNAFSYEMDSTGLCTATKVQAT